MPDPGNTLVDALPIDVPLPVPLVESVGAADPDDYYVFTTTGYTDFRLDLTGLGADADVALLDANGFFLDGSLNGGNQPEAIVRAGLAPGTYYIWVNAFLGDTTYNLSVSTTPSVEPGNTLGTARAIGTVGPGTFSFNYQDLVSPLDGIDFFRFTVAQASDIAVTLEGLGSLGDADLEIRNASGTVIRSSALPGPFDLDSATAFGLAPGTYYIRVNQYAFAPGPSPYALSVLGAPAASLPPDTGGQLDSPARLVAAGTTLGATAVTRNDAVGFRDPFDLWSFSTTVASNFSLTLSGLTADVDVFLVADTVPLPDTPIAEGINLGTSAEEFSVPLPAGGYLLIVTAPNVFDTSRYTLQARAVPVNAGAVDGAGNTLAAARIVANLPDGQQTFTDSVGGGDASDYYRITTGYATDFSVSLTGLSADAGVQLLNSAGTVIGSNPVAGTGNEAITRPNLAAGNYFVRVLPVGTASTPYTLTLNAPIHVPTDPSGQTFDDPEGDVGQLDAVPRSFTDYVGSQDRDDWYRFTTAGTSNLRLSLTGLTADADVAVLDSAGAVVLGSSANGGSATEQLSLDALPAGTYTVNVFSFAGDTNYTLTLSAAPPPDAAGSGPATARAVGPLAAAERTFTDFVGAGDTDDYYRFTTAAASNFRLSLTGLRGNADVVLLTSSGTEIVSSTQAGETPESIARDNLAAGTYYVRVLNAVGGADTGYTLRMSAGPASAADGAGNDRGTARNLEALGATNRTFTDYVGASDAADFYRFTTAGVSNFRLAMTAMTADADVQLQDAGGNVIASSAAGGSGNEAIAFNNLAAGTYFVHVYPYSGSTRYTLALRAEAPPVPDGAGNGPATARLIGTLGVAPVVFTDFVGTADLNDYYRFTTTSPSNFRLRLDGLSADANVQLLTANGTGPVVDGTQEADGAEAIAFSLGAGTHLIRVAPGTGANTPYRLTAAAEAPADNGPNSFQDAGSADLGVVGTTQARRDDFVGSGDPHDYYRFSTDRTSNLLVNLTGLTADADVEILDSLGNRVGLASAGGATAETLRLNGLAAGEYTAHVMQAAGNTRYTLGITAQAPADGAGNAAAAPRAVTLTPFDQSFRDFVSTVPTGATGAPIDGNDWYRFTLTAQSTVTLGLTGLTGDANIQLRSGTGGVTEIGSGSNAGLVDESITQVLGAGTYWIRVFPAAPGINADYTLMARAEPTSPADGAGQSTATARVITVGATQQKFSDFVGAADPADFYRFGLAQASGLRVSLTGATATTGVVLIQANGQPVGADRTPGIDQFEFDRLAAGTYYLRVFPEAEVPSFYTLGVRTVPADDLPATAATNALVVPGGLPFSGSVENAGDVDWIKVNLTAGQTYTIRQQAGAAPAGLGDPAIRGVFDANGLLQPGTTNDDFGGSRDSLVTFAPAASGAYYIAAGAASDTSGAYRVSVSAVNLAPVAGTPLPAQHAAEGQPFSLRLPWQLFTDPEGGPLTLTAALSDGRDLPAWLRFDGESETFSTPPTIPGVPAGSPDLTIRITARDIGNATVSSTFLLRTPGGGDDFAASAQTTGTVTVGDTARGAIETAFDTDWFRVSLGEGQTVTIDLRGTHSGGGTLADPFLVGMFGSTGSSIPGFSNDDAPNTLDSRVVFTAPSAGDYFIAAGAYGTGTGSYTVAVTGSGNQAPQAAPLGIPNQQAREGAAFSYQVPLGAFTDPEGQALTYAATLGSGAALPAWLAFNSATRTFTGTPPASGPDLTVRVTARDPGGLTASDDFVLATPAPGATTRDAWTLMVYLAADNNLEEFALKDLNEMEAVNLPSSVNVVVMVDRAPGFSTGSGNWTDTRRGQIVRDANGTTVTSPLTSLGELNTGDPRTLTGFIDWASSNFQAERYGLVVWDHGGGLSGVAWDDSSAGSNLSIAETSRAIAASTLGRLDFVGFDTCLQGMVEQAVDLRALADVVVASQDLEPGDGWDYSGWLNQLAANPNLDEFQVANAAVTAYGSFYQNRQTLAAVGTSALDDLTAAIDNFVFRAVSDGSPMTAGDRSGIIAARNGARSFSNQSNRDLGGFMSAVNINTNIAPDIRGAASQVVTALETAELAQTGAPNTSGLSIFLPNSASAAGMSEYNSTNYRFLAETQWRSFLTALNT